MSKLLDYLNLLDKDAPTREAHTNNAVASMTQHGLNDEEQKAFLSWDKAAIAKLTGVNEGAFPVPQVSNSPYGDS